MCTAPSGHFVKCHLMWNKKYISTESSHGGISPVNANHCPCIVSMLVQCLRRRAECRVSTGIIFSPWCIKKCNYQNFVVIIYYMFILTNNFYIYIKLKKLCRVFRVKMKNRACGCNVLTRSNWADHKTWIIASMLERCMGSRFSNHETRQIDVKMTCSKFSGETSRQIFTQCWFNVGSSTMTQHKANVGSRFLLVWSVRSRIPMITR